MCCRHFRSFSVLSRDHHTMSRFSFPPPNTPLHHAYLDTARCLDTPGDLFFDPQRCRDELPMPALVPPDPTLLKNGIIEEDECAFWCQKCRFFYSVPCEPTEWPFCPYCGTNWHLVATGHLPFSASTEKEPCCYCCKQFAGKLDKLACTLCNFLLKKAVAGDVTSVLALGCMVPQRVAMKERQRLLEKLMPGVAEQSYPSVVPLGISILANNVDPVVCPPSLQAPFGDDWQICVDPSVPDPYSYILEQLKKNAEEGEDKKVSLVVLSPEEEEKQRRMFNGAVLEQRSFEFPPSPTQQ
jgi:hypothetical protein